MALTVVMKHGKQDTHLACGHKLRGLKFRPRINQIFNCHQCDKGKPLSGKPFRETKTWKELNNK